MKTIKFARNISTMYVSHMTIPIMVQFKTNHSNILWPSNRHMLNSNRSELVCWSWHLSPYGVRVSSCSSLRERGVFVGISALNQAVLMYGYHILPSILIQLWYLECECAYWKNVSVMRSLSQCPWCVLNHIEAHFVTQLKYMYVMYSQGVVHITMITSL